MSNTRLLFLTFIASLSLAAAPITIQFGIPGDLLVSPYNNANSGWFVQFTNGDAALRIDSVTVNVASRFQVNVGSCILSAGCGFNSAIVSGANVGTPGFTGVTSISNGTASFTMSFSDFNAGEQFKFLLDLDDTISQPFPASPFANAVTAADMIAGGNSVTYSMQVSGVGYQTTVFTGALTSTASLDNSAVPLDLVAVQYAVGTITGDVPLAEAAVPEIPEPSTYALMTLGIAGMALASRYSRKK